MPDTPLLDWITTPDQHWQDHVEGWKRDEARAMGGDAILPELTKFDSEDADSYDLRVRTARYWNIPDKNASFIAGHIVRAMPMPNFGKLGEVRERAQIDTKNLAELLWYNCNGIGEDGQQLLDFINSIIKRACVTGYRGVYVEMPEAARLRTISTQQGREDRVGRITAAERAAGWHPYLVEVSPIAWTRRRYTEGTLDEAVIKVKVPSRDPDAINGEEDGYYVLVREGYALRGPTWQEGGWWILGQDQRVIQHATWADTRGRIPLVRAIGKHSVGTHDKPAMAQSLTTELGQIAIDLMNARSEQRYNARQAAKTLLFGLGMDGPTQQQTATQILGGSMLVAVPAVTDQLTGAKLIPQMWSSSSVALDTGVYTAIIGEGIAEAKEIMVTQVTSTPESTGESKKAGFDEGVSPLLSGFCLTTETWVNSVLEFYSLRGGITEPDASVTMPKKLKLSDLLSDIDRMVTSMEKSLLSSPTWRRNMLVAQGDELGTIKDEDRKTILKELDVSAARQSDLGAGEYWSKVSAALTALTGVGGMTPEGAGFLLGLTPEQLKVLQTGVPPGMPPAPERAAPTAAEKAARAAAIAQRLGEANGGTPPNPQNNNGGGAPPPPAEESA